jgi:uncharacterized membrane protein
MRLWGHPIHPMLVHFPVALWTVATVAYIGDAAGVKNAAAVAQFSDGVGLITAVLAMTAGLIELRSIGSRDEAMRVAISHMMAMATAWICFMSALVIPISAGAGLDHSTAQLIAVAAACLGFLLMGIGGWLGGRLVYEFGIGVAAREK